MTVKISVFLAGLVLAFAGLREPCLAQPSRDLENNAALQYYSAFLQMKDADLSDAEVKELGEIVAGAQPYNDDKFGKLVENNAQAVETMMLGATFSECDWGLAPLSEKFGWQTPVPYFWRSRVLGRLDILYVLHAWGEGDHEKAVDALSGGMKFAKHVSSGGPLVPALIAKMLLLQQLSVANRLLDSGKLTPAEKKTLGTTLADLGTDGIDWQAAADVETKGMKVGLDQLRSAPDQREYYKLMWNKDAPADFHGVTQQDYTDVAKVASVYAKLFRDGNPDAVKLATSVATRTVQMMVPNPEKALKSKQELQTALEETKAKLH
jgi:hypothetical protein